MKKLLALCMLILTQIAMHAQSIDISWSEQFKYDNKLDGFFDSFEGANSQFVYAKFSNLALREKKRNKKIKLIAFDKNTMKKVGDVQLKGYGKENDGMIYLNTYVFEKGIYVVWIKESKKKKEYFAQAFDEKLRKLYKATKIYEQSTEKGHNDNVAILGNNKAAKLMILKEFPITKDDENLRVEFKMLNADLSFGSVQQVTLPIQFSKKRRLFSSSNNGFKVNYELGDDAFLYVQDLIKMDDEDRKNLSKGESSVYTYFAQINPENGTLKDYRVKYDNINTFKVSYVLDKGKIKLYGFFSDLNKDSKGNDTHGIFYVCINNYNFKMETKHFEYFDKRLLDELYAKDREDQKHGKGLLKSKKAKKSDDESISDSYEIEQTISDGNNLTLFCSIMNNYSRQVCSTSNGVTTCRTEYYCNKRNVTVFKLNGDGQLMWAKNMDREITYSGWYVYDIRAVKNNNNYFVLYGSNSDLDGKRKRRGRGYFNDKLEYAIFSANDGNYKQAEYTVNEKKTKKKEKKYVTIMQITKFDNQMYTQCVRVRRKPGVFISLLFPPLYMILQFNTNLMKGTGYLASISAKG